MYRYSKYHNRSGPLIVAATTIIFVTIATKVYGVIKASIDSSLELLDSQLMVMNMDISEIVQPVDESHRYKQDIEEKTEKPPPHEPETVKEYLEQMAATNKSPPDGKSTGLMDELAETIAISIKKITHTLSWYERCIYDLSREITQIMLSEDNR